MRHDNTSAPDNTCAPLDAFGISSDCFSRESLFALFLLESSGHEAWIVGGAVRDAIRGVEAHDCDIATSAHYQETAELFRSHGFQAIETGADHGTVTVVIDNVPLEITTYRIDGSYSDNRHPDSIAFAASIEEDLARRDFTINAIAFHPKRGFADPFGGVEDIRNKVLRCVGNPTRRFEEDALRILRGCRFCSQLGFFIDDETLSAMKARKHLLDNISSERITNEMTRFLLGDFVHDALMTCIDVIDEIIPEAGAMKGFDQCTPYHVYDVLEHSAWVTQKSPADSALRWAAFLHDIGKPETFRKDDDGVGHFPWHASASLRLAENILARMRLSSKEQATILFLILHHDDEIEPTPGSVCRYLIDVCSDASMPEPADALFRMLCQLKLADAQAHNSATSKRDGIAIELEHALETCVSAKLPYTVKNLSVNGSDLIALGLPSGPKIGETLKTLQYAIAEGELSNDRDSCLAFAKRLASAK